MCSQGEAADFFVVASACLRCTCVIRLSGLLRLRSIFLAGIVDILSPAVGASD